MLLSLLSFLVTMGIVIVFHEYGHYLAARYYDVHVERFSLGFGKVIWKKVDRRGTEWALSALPLGGYVKPLAEPRLGHPDYKVGESVAEKSSWEKIVIYAAGPAFSFLLGIIIYAMTFMVGQEEPQAILAKPALHSLADKAGLIEGDRILAIDGEPKASWFEVADALVEPSTLGHVVRLTVEHPSGNVQDVELDFPAFSGELEGADLLKEAGLVLKSPEAFVARVIADGPAEKAGLKAGDKVLAINHTPMVLPELIEKIKSSANQALNLTIWREGAQIQLSVTPDAVTDEQGRTIGRIQTQFQAQFPTQWVRYAGVDAIGKAIEKTWNTAWLSLKMMGRMITGEVSFKNLSGPLTIADYSGRVVQYGWMNFLQFVALISVSIGVLNLLPVPGLDGGQMVLNFIELVRGKPIPEKIMETVMKTGYGLLFILMVFAFNNDLMRLFQ